MTLPLKISIIVSIVLIVSLGISRLEVSSLQQDKINLNVVIANERNKSNVAISETIACKDQLNKQSLEILQYEKDIQEAWNKLNIAMETINENSANRINNISPEKSELDNAKDMLSGWLK